MSSTPQDMTPDQLYLAKLESAIEQIWDIALRFGLDPYPVHFEVVPATIMYEFGAYGLPGRFGHWSRGKAYYRMKTEYDYGLSKIYELVVNTNPSYAFLMEQNDLLQNQVVAAHVLGHTDFFKNNVYFRRTPPNMIDKVSVNADRVRQYEYDHGIDKVERFLDAVLAIEEHIDPSAYARPTPGERSDADARPGDGEGRKRTTVYDDLWALDMTAEQREAVAAEAEKRAQVRRRRFPAEPEKDILKFLAEHAPNLEPWQRDLLLIVREEMLYFVPQMRTKTINEGWACLVGSSLVQTEHGLLPYETLHRRLAAGESIQVASGPDQLDAITDRHIRRDAPTIRLRTRRGLVIEGAEEHKLSIGDDQWIALKDVQVGQRIPLTVGANVWPSQMVAMPTPPRATFATVADVATAAGVSVHTVYRSMSGKTAFASNRIKTAIQTTGYRFDFYSKPVYRKRTTLRATEYVDEHIAAFLGYLIGDGNIHVSKSGVGFTSGDRESVDHYAGLVRAIFGIEPRVFWDARTVNGRGGRWRVVFYSANVLSLLSALGIDVNAKARRKRIPDVILRSPKPVVSAFLRAYFDSDGCASTTGGVLLSTFSDEIALSLQVLLLNYGILTRKHGLNVGIRGRSAAIFEREIGFGLARKQEKLHAYVSKRRWFVKEDPTDTVVAIEHDVADVYDITVADSHRYVANGMVHHNSLWHARITREMDLDDNQFTQFAQMHAGVLATSRMRINPYHLGYHLLEDIERRWDNPTEEEQRMGRQPGQGHAKLFEVRETESDVSLLRNYLTKDLVEKLDLYLYRKEGDEWVIVEKNWEKVRDGLVASMTNFGYPYITVWDADFNGNTELLLHHHFEGQELDIPYAEKTLEHMYQIWSRPVHLETMRDGKAIRLSYNGERHVRLVRDGDE